MSIRNASTLRNFTQSLNQLENDIVSLYWSVYSLNISFNDIMTDRFDTEDGIDKTKSFYSYNILDKSISKPSLGNLILVTKPWEASRNNPTNAYVILEIETQTQIQLNADVLIQISTDGGINFFDIKFLSYFKENGFLKYIKGTISGIPRMNSNLIRTKVICTPVALLKIRALATGIKYSI